MDIKSYKQPENPSIARNIRVTLAAGLLVSCILIAVIGLTSWETLNILDEHIQDVVEESSQKTSLLYDMRITARERNLHLVIILLMEDPFRIDEQWMKFRNEGSKFLIAREKFIALGIDEREKQLLEKQRALSIDTVALQYELHEYILQGDRESSLKVFRKHLLMQEKVFNALDTLLNLQKIKNDKKVKSIKQEQSLGLKKVVTFSVAVIVVIILITIYIIKRISEQALFIENEGLKFKALIEGSMDSVLVLDWEGVTDCNKNALKMFSVASLDELNEIGFDYFSEFSEEKLAKESDGVFTAVNHAMVESRRKYQWEFRDALGQIFPADVELTGIELQGRSFVQMIIRDVTERERFQKELREANENLESKVMERTNELKELNTKTAGIARSAGMAEVASGVLHNVGNVLNSVNVTTSILKDQIRKCKSDKLDMLVTLLEQHKDDLANFLQNDEKGKFVIPYLKQLSTQLTSEQKNQIDELNGLSDNVEHIKNIITMQQTYTGGMGVSERIKISSIVDDAVKINIASMSKHGINLIKDIGDDPEVTVDKHRLIQVMVNLISNAKHAVENGKKKNKEIVVGAIHEGEKIIMFVKDNGIGIDEADLSKLFEFGFKKRAGGHGFGLHHSALVAKEMGGKLTVESDGLGEGAKFILEFPVNQSEPV